MSSNIIWLLQGKQQKYRPKKSWAWWDENIAPKDILFIAFKSAIKNASADDWEKVNMHLVEWTDCIPVKDKKRTKQFTQAVKLYVGAKFVSELPAEDKDLSDSLKSSKLDKDQRITLNNKIQEKIALLPTDFNYLKSELNNSKTDLIFLCELFAQEIDWNWVEVPVVAKQKHQEVGKVYNLELKKVLIYGEVMANPTFLENPAEYIKDDFLQSIGTALKFNREFWEKKKEEREEIWEKANQDKDFDKFGFIWDVVPLEVKNDNLIEENLTDADKSGTEEKRGESAGLAAAVAIYHALLNQIPDNRVVYSARLETSSKDSNPTGEIKPVEGIIAKIKAAIKTDFIDTFVMHEDNFNEKKNEIMKLIEGKPFRIKTINSDGSKIETYPETLVNNSISQDA